jgi:hypothetical protein
VETTRDGTGPKVGLNYTQLQIEVVWKPMEEIATISSKINEKDNNQW